ncbi:hypothetical protein KL935_004322 [Ogataea polymorpha]|nr:hypothetical protein KL908_004455 [Ogataea polymorpha]KAG7898723.1 hypothetical protein KL935_004322 [Ogataea polymorpha]KAG7907186.1 hypothetical protein KL906_004372 [Ogataea polymorpha]
MKELYLFRRAARSVTSSNVSRGLDPNKIRSWLDNSSDHLRETSSAISEIHRKSKTSKPTSPIDGPYLNNYFANKSDLPVSVLTSMDRGNVSRIINESEIRLDWSIYDLNKLPGEDRRAAAEAGLDQPGTSHENKGQLLPEVILLGRCNVGKSSLVNALMSNNKQSATTYAKVKQSAGYTPCLNFYNVGGLFRLVDSPGYGVKGKPWQGELTMRYLAERRELKNCFLILNGDLGLNKYDELILEALVEMGVQFDIIFNKIDKIKNESRIQHYEELISRSILNDLKIKPRMYFANSIENDLKQRTGINEIRYGILQSCGYSDLQTLKPRRRRKTINETIEKIKEKNARKSLKAQAKANLQHDIH